MVENMSSDCEIKCQTESDGMDCDFSTLPPHVLANILSHLAMEDFKKASETCKAMYYASCDPRIAENILLYFTSEPTEMDIFVRPVTKFRFEYLNFDKFNYRQLLRRFGDKITELHINSCSRLRITQLFEMFIYLPNLKVLRLEYGTRYYKPTNFNKYGRITRNKDTIIRNLGRVQELYVNTIEKNLKGAEILLNYCTNLKVLNWNKNCYHEEPDYFLHSVLINRNNNCTSECLESLTVHSIDRKQNTKFFEHLIHLNRTRLRSLDLKEISDTYYDVMFKEFCKTYCALEHLTMYGCNNEQLADICKYMRDLKTLDLSNVTATNFNLISNLNKLETFILRRTFGTIDDPLIEYFRAKPNKITDLTLNNINTVLLREICENVPQLKSLYLECVETKECEPIFRHLIKLEKIQLEFSELSTINSTKIESDPEWNITKLVELEYLYVTTFVPGITPDLINKLSKLKSKHHDYVYDYQEPDETEEEPNEDNENYEENPNENNEGEEVPDAPDEPPVEEAPEEEQENREYDMTEFACLFEWLGEPPNNDAEEVQPAVPNEPPLEEEENREYDVTEFKCFSELFYDTENNDDEEVTLNGLFQLLVEDALAVAEEISRDVSYEPTEAA